MFFFVPWNNILIEKRLSNTNATLVFCVKTSGVQEAQAEAQEGVRGGGARCRVADRDQIESTLLDISDATSGSGLVDGLKVLETHEAILRTGHQFRLIGSSGAVAKEDRSPDA